MYDFDKTIDRTNTFSLKWDVKHGELPLSLGDMDFEVAPEITEAIVKRANHGVFGYAIVPDEWSDAIISWWKHRHNFEIDKSWLQFCTGVVPAISSSVKRITNHGDRVAVLTPAYDIFYHSIENAGRTVAECRLVYDGKKYAIDFSSLEEILSHPLTTMLIFCNPHNPTGNIWTRDEIKRVGKLCRKYGVTVLSDEIHCDLTMPSYEYTPFASASSECAEVSVTCVAASKAFNLAGMQSAAVIVPNKLLREKVVRGLNSDEVAEPNCFATVSTTAAFNCGGEWLDALKKYLAANRKFAEEYLGKKLPKAHAVEANATYMFWVDCGAFTNNTYELCAFLRENTGLIVSPGGQYRGDSFKFVRMNLACSRERLTEGLDRFVRGVKAYEK